MNGNCRYYEKSKIRRRLYTERKGAFTILDGGQKLIERKQTVEGGEGTANQTQHALPKEVIQLRHTTQFVR